MIKPKRLLSIALVAVMALTVVSGAGLLIASGAQHDHTVPFVGRFSGTSTSISGSIDDVGTGVFTHCGKSQVTGHEIATLGAPYSGTITAANGDKIYFSGSVTSGTYTITGGTGRFANVVGGTGQFSLERSTIGQQDIVSGRLDGTIIFSS